VPPACAECQPDRQLATSREPRREQQVSHVCAGDRQHQQHGTHQHAQRLADVADDDLVVRADVDAVVVTELHRERPAQRAHLGGGAFDGDAFLEPRVDVEEVRSARRGIQLALQRHEDVGVAMVEPVRHHAITSYGSPSKVTRRPMTVGSRSK
jgi:hypothetical protein